MEPIATRRWGEVARRVLSVIWAVLLAITDGIIALSLMRKGSRPRPGTRRAWPKGLKEELHRDQRGLCVYCRRRIRADASSHIDHILPVNQGGTNDRENLQLLCACCNIRKSDRSDAEFRSRYRSLLPPNPGQMPRRTITQSEFRRVAARTTDPESYARFKAGKYLTAAQKVNGGALATGIGVACLLFFPLNSVMAPTDASVLLIASLGAGAVSGGWVRFRAWRTGKDQED